MPPRILHFPKNQDSRGNLTFLEYLTHIPFQTKRICWSNFGKNDGKHFEQTLKAQQIVIALHGSFDVVVTNKDDVTEIFTLKCCDQGVYLPPETRWKTINYSSDALALHITNRFLSEKDYIVDFKQFVCLEKDNRNIVLNCKLLNINQEIKANQCITAIENILDTPFEVKRIFYLYDIPSAATRGMHAHKTCHQILVAVRGSFDVLLDDGKNRKQMLLNQSNVGLHIPPGIWASEINFSKGAICLVLASHQYDKDDYIRNYEDFLLSKINFSDRKDL